MNMLQAKVPALWIQELVRGRRSIRSFTSRPVPRALVESILEDALWAPSPHNSQPWRFTVLETQGIKEKLALEMAHRLEDELRADGLDAAAIERQTERSRRRIESAPVVILCSIVADGLVQFDDIRRSELESQMAVQSVGAALQTLFLVAAACGLGSCWMAAPMYCPDVVRRVLDLPDHQAPQALILLGYAAGPGRNRDRRTLQEVVEFQ